MSPSVKWGEHYHVLGLLRGVSQVTGKHLASCLAHSNCSINSSLFLIINVTVTLIDGRGHCIEDAWVGAKSSGRDGGLKGL